MKKKPYPFSSLLIAPLVMLLILAALQCESADEMPDTLSRRVSALDLGLNGYVIGRRLSEAQKLAAAANPVDHAYSGTYKFSDGELLIVAAENDDTVLAVYQRHEKADIAQTRKMISGLMGLFGEPTVMAHDKLIYWAFNAQGKIPEEQYAQLRSKGEKFDVLATVKFSSTLPVTQENPDPAQTGAAYFIISSDPLLQDFMRQ